MLHKWTENIQKNTEKIKRSKTFYILRNYTRSHTGTFKNMSSTIEHPNLLTLTVVGLLLRNLGVETSCGL